MAPRVRSGAPCQEVVLEGNEVDLARLPVQTCWPGDAGPLITWGLTVTRGPAKPRQNLGIYRQQVLGANRVIMEIVILYGELARSEKKFPFSGGTFLPPPAQRRSGLIRWSP